MTWQEIQSFRTKERPGLCCMQDLQGIQQLLFLSFLLPLRQESPKPLSGLPPFLEQTPHLAAVDIRPLHPHQPCARPLRERGQGWAASASMRTSNAHCPRRELPEPCEPSWGTPIALQAHVPGSVGQWVAGCWEMKKSTSPAWEGGILC